MMKNYFFQFLSIVIFLSSIQSLAIPLNEDSLNDFLEKSKKDPDRLYMLKLGATWCGYCRQEAEWIKGISTTDKSAVSRAYWDNVEIDKIPEGTAESFLSTLGVARQPGLPFTIAFKGGVPIGSIDGYDQSAIKSFVSDAEVVNPSTLANSQATLNFQKFPCGPNDKKDACIVGLSGFGSSKITDTDDFGRMNLKTFADLFSDKSFIRLMAPSPKTRGTKNTPSGKGVFYVKNPFLDQGNSLDDAALAPDTFDKLDTFSGKNVRLLFTGHGGPKGLNITNSDNPDSSGILDALAVEKGIQKARVADKKVKGLVVQCYGGQYGFAFMPDQLSKTAAIQSGLTACAAFASLPEKTSEGCYPISFTPEKQDYVSLAQKFKKCDGSQTARQLHYEITTKGEGHDIPMLSSEYFLTYGPGALFLGNLNQGKGTAPKGGLVKNKLDENTTVYIDYVNYKIVKTIYKGKEFSNPEMTLQGCQGDNSYGPTFDGVHRGSFFLKSSTTGLYGMNLGDCAPVFDLSWSKEKGDHPNGIVLFLSPPQNLKSDAYNLEDLSLEEKLIDVTGLKVEARALFSAILPHVEKYFDGQDINKAVEALAKDIRENDPDQADAILSLFKRVQEKYKSAKIDASVLKNSIEQIMIRNVSSYESEGEIPESRLAYLLAAGTAELALREAAKTNTSAASLVKQLDDLKSCEKDLY